PPAAHRDPRPAESGGTAGAHRAPAGSASGPAFSPRPRREMAAATRRGPGHARRDRGCAAAPARGGAVLELCAPFVRALAQGQPGGAAAEADALWNFETAVRENVTINGQPWEEASDDSELQSSNIKILEDQFDELIVETASRRQMWPKKILVHVVQTLKAEQEMLKLYQPVVKPAEIRSPPSQGKDFVEMAILGFVLQSIPALIEKAEGFSQALTWQPTLELCKLRQEVFSGCKAKEENNAQDSVAPGEVTPTETVTSKNPYVLLKKRKVAASPKRRHYPIRRRKITLST
uniref:NSL1 component of MIS12 kinetochore complex n=1 Tax=Malurus cyaneus samueli TaxID=2593467 RepID=A0A8C5X1T0_9PASS